VNAKHGMRSGLRGAPKRVQRSGCYSRDLLSCQDAGAVEKEQTAEHDANNQRVLKEAQPIKKQQVAQMAGFSADFAQQLQSNPRLARLMQLADNKHCKGGG
jgi:hypothetical protein